VAGLVLVVPGCQVESGGDDADTGATAERPFVTASDSIAAGRYLVVAAGCNDCHTPGYMENPAAVSETVWLTGVPIGFRGPWGTSYARNLRLTASDMTADEWVEMFRTRTSLPPMPWHNVKSMSERDARAIYHYIRTLRPLGQPAPLPVGPEVEPETPYFLFVPQHMERLGAQPAAAPGPPAPADSAAADTSAAPAAADR
jgi:hypothetical protein